MYRLSLLSITLLVATSFVASSMVFGGNESTSDDGRLRDLMAQRRDVLQSRVSEVMKLYRNGTAGVEKVFEATQDLLEAKLALASTQQEREVILKSQVDNMEALEQTMEARFKNGNAGASEYLHAKAERLAAEINLLRAR